jgi:hypothetical protein
VDLVSVVLASEVVHELPMPALAYGAIFMVGFIALGIVTFSYRDVANRHSQKRPPSGGHH